MHQTASIQTPPGAVSGSTVPHTTTQVMLCENRRAVGEAFSARLNGADGVRCLGIARNYFVARRQLPAASPDAVVVTLDYHFDELRMLAAEAGPIPVVYLADPPTAQMTWLADRYENLSILPAQAPFDELISALHGRPPAPPVIDSADAQLTEREFQTLSLLVEGLNAKEMAARLHLSIHTIRFHIKTLLAKLGVSTQSEAILAGIERGFVRPSLASSAR